MNPDTLNKAGYRPLVEITRGYPGYSSEIPESVHFGALAVVDSAGKLVASVGDPALVTFLRSSAKPLQALPFIQAGGPDAFGLTRAEIALMCGSHSGTDAHAEGVQGFQAKAGVDAGDLRCGVHPSFHQPTAEAMLLRGEEPSPIRHNCSGKHTGMLAYARLNGWPVERYLEPDHPVQQEILTAFAEMCGLEPGQVILGIDGCSAPNFAVPLQNAALAYVRLCDPAALSPERRSACESITEAMWAEPGMVGGPGRFDTTLMSVCRGRILSKGGAEGYQALGAPSGALGPGSPGLGIAIKISDGDQTSRARHAVALETLRQLGLASAQDLEALADFGPEAPVLNQKSVRAGAIRPVFRLDL
ncbi:MAG TPA: asparaginase [Anaerolineales bacterium]|nr:asparaginase [Anaerolineales bacterium]